jgi:predicted peptidase
MPLLDQTADPSGETINFGGVSPGDQAGQDNAIAALQQVESEYSTDPTRIYMTGNSLGGIGTWDTMLKYNAYDGTQGQIFDAGMPLAGNDYAIPADQAAQELAAGNVPMWSYHGADDTQVPNGFDEQVAADLQNDPNYHYTEVANTGHDVWDSVYTDPSTWNWLFSQQGPAPASSTATATATS